MIVLLAATSWVDVSIPLVSGLLMCACPQLTMRKTGSPEKDAARTALARKLGIVLIFVAGIYYLTSTFSTTVS